ncbi:rhodanese-like domain-containing protein [Paeniroseomonas aquatica]|uniref:rhodanese-like domain-containing protein n=1 Tax=Paeniroseomonas aquatica TaxID=373043 RepID=UPI003610288E
MRRIDRAGLDALLADPARTTHVLDVRDPAEYAAGHLPGSRSAPGGQLVQGTDNWVAVRGARLVLVDDTGVRARMTGGWLRQLGQWEVFVLEDGLEGPLEQGHPAPACPEAAALRPATVAPAELSALLAEGSAQVVQLSRSTDFREGHIPGALWGVRSRLAGLAPRLAGARRVVVAGPDEAIARLAVPELQALAAAPVMLLAGGLAAWKAAGLPLARDRRTPADADCIDAYLRPYDRNDGVEAAMREYLSWEIDLVHEVARDGDARFGTR